MINDIIIKILLEVLNQQVEKIKACFAFTHSTKKPQNLKTFNLHFAVKITDVKHKSTKKFKSMLWK